MKYKVVLVIYLLLIISFTSAIKAQKSNAGEDSTSYITFHNISKAWKFSNGSGVKVAVLGWMFDLSPEASKKYINPVSMIPGQDIGVYKPWHGEWMAEIIHKIAPGAKIIPIRTRPASKKDDEKAAEPNYQKYLIAGIKCAADHGAAIITSSMGPVKQTNELNDAVIYAEKKALYL